MKKCHRKILVFAIWLFGYAGCNKSTVSPGSLIGKWNVDSVQIKRWVINETTYVTIYKPTVDYYNFTEDTLYLFWEGKYYVPSHYQMKLLNGQHVIQYPFSADTIISLTSHEMLLKSPESADSKIFLSR